MGEIYDPVIMLNPDAIRIADTARVDSFCKLEGGQGLTIGAHVHIASLCHVNIGGGRVILQMGSALASGAKILGGSNSKEGESMSAAAPRDQQVVERLVTTIGKNAFIGVNAVVLPGVVVGERAVIGAGAVVTHDVPPSEIWAGVPARKIGVR